MIKPSKARTCAEAFQKAFGGHIEKCGAGLAVCLENASPMRVIFVQTGKWRTNIELEFYIHYPEFDLSYSQFRGFEIGQCRSGFGFYLSDLAELQNGLFDFEDGFLWKKSLRPRGLCLTTRMRLALLPKKIDVLIFADFLFKSVCNKISFDGRWNAYEGLLDLVTKRDGILSNISSPPDFKIYLVALFLCFHKNGYHCAKTLSSSSDWPHDLHCCFSDGHKFVDYLNGSQ
jgi:hypothetical protein